MMKIFFYRFSYFVRKRMTQSEIVMQEPFILHRSCDLGNYCKECRVAWGGGGTVDTKNAALSKQRLLM